MFFIIEISEETTFEFLQKFYIFIKMETQKIVNLLNSSENEFLKLATKKWYVIDRETKGDYLHHNPIKFLLSSLESSICDYSDAYILDILVIGDTTATGGNANTMVAFKNWAPFKKCGRKINDTFAEEADFINIAMPMCNLIEYSDNYSDISGSLWQFKRDEIATNANVCNANNSSFKYNSSLIGNVAADGKKSAKTAVPFKYLSNFWRSLEMPLINCKVELSLTWIDNCVLPAGENTDNTGAVENAGTAATLKPLMQNFMFLLLLY